MNSDARFASENAALRKNVIGSIGCGARSSQATNAATRAMPSPRAVRISGLVQPWSLPRIRPQTIPNMPALTSPTPGRSSLPAGPCVSVSRVSASGTSTIPIGTLSQKMYCHEKPSTTAPPTTGPNAIARPPIAPHAPSARPRRAGGTAAERIVSVSGITIAPPSPCTARAMLSTSTFGASAAATEASVKIDDADREHAPAPEAVTERGAREEQDGERQRVRVDGPREALERGV